MNARELTLEMLKADWTDYAIKLKKDVEGKKGTLPKGAVLKIVKADCYPTNTNLKVQDANGNFAIIMVDPMHPFPHEIVHAN